ncbi:MAG: 50S ribosomal protein L3 [Phycisphaerae bacterium]|nr:50S ribosomal protein L3 [Phycisphaerae bacterium]HAW95046.1 50S ribosomal protein L3 [Phycisphaerales bacterium]
MPIELVGRKIGMTRYFTEDGKNIPVSVIEVGPCIVTQLKTVETDGYSAVQIGFEDMKARRSTRAQIAHDAKAGAAPKRVHAEFRCDSDDEVAEYELGQVLTVEALSHLVYVDVEGVSKGKGFQGVMKRHHFRGLEASHGVQRAHRSPGSIGGGGINLGTGPKIKKGRRMSGHMGSERVTMRSLDVVSIDNERNLMLVKGPVPGPNTGILHIKTPSRLYKPKAKAQAAADKG